MYSTGTFSKSAWATRLIALNRDPEKIKKFRMIRKVVLYYGAILDFFERMTADRRYLVRVHRRLISTFDYHVNDVVLIALKF